MYAELEHQALGRLLRELPDGAARPYDWREFQRRAQARAAGMAGARTLVATLLVVVAICATAIRLEPSLSPPPPHAAATPQRPGHYGTTQRAEDINAERWLESLPREPALVHVGTRAAVETLEDHIAQVDDLVSAARAGRTSSTHVQLLLEERAQLVSSLVQVRYAETLADASR